MSDLFNFLKIGKGVAERKTVLVIDDSVVDRKLAEKALSKRYNVLTAEDGRVGVDMAFQHRPDLILLDFVMPVMDGPEACGVLKNDPRTENIPVVFLTTMDKPECFVNGLIEGADSYLTKPIKMGELISEVDLRIKYAISERKDL